MLSLEQIQEIIQQKVKTLNFSGQPVELYEPIHYTLNLGGKRLRPALCLLACDMFDGDIDDALGPAIGIEIFHNFTLLHDDIMDQAPIRRGKTTVYKKWNQNIAILSGDTMMALAYGYIMEAPEKVKTDVFSVFNKTAIEVCEGQQYDMNFETQAHVTIPDYIEMIRLKTAVLLAGSLKIGALIGGASTDDAEKLYKFGENLGIAFQLKDDLLDAFGEEDKFGKMKGGDIISNKKTYLYLKAFELATGKSRDEIRHFFSPEMKNQNEKIEGVLRIYEKLNIRHFTENEILTYYRNALNYLDSIDVQKSRKFELISIADQLNSRKF
jgi:geranylgeranyl diphosphate synthase, type II